MIFQIGMNPKLAETVFRSVINGFTKTASETTASVGLGVGMPVILATATASANGYYCQMPATSTAATLENNLFIGVLDHSLGTNSSYLAGEDVGVVQCYGYRTAKLASGTDAIAVGVVCVPDIGNFVTAVGPMTATAATATAAHTESKAMGGLAYLISIPATATAVRDVGVFLRCM